MEKHKSNIVEYLIEEKQRVSESILFTYEISRSDSEGKRIRKKSVIKMLFEQ